MMFWYGNDMDSWGYALMGVSTVVVWGLVALGVFALIRYLNRSERSAGSRATPEQVLAERFARGDIDEPEYRQRLDVLDGGPRLAGRP